MSKAEILAELPKLTAEDRAEIQAKLDELAGEGWLDADDPLTDAEKALLQYRRSIPGRSYLPPCGRWG